MKASLVHILPAYLCSAILFLFSAGSGAQQTGLKIYTINDGLPSMAAHNVHQDKYGYLWVSTQAGISRFDGRQFVNYGVTDGLPSLIVGNILQDSKDRLWIGTTAGMAQFKDNRFITYPTTDNLDINYVFNLIETKDKKVWALTDKGVYEFTDSLWKKVALCPGFDNTPTRGIVEMNDELYVVYAHDLFCRTGNGKWLHVEPPQEKNFFYNYISVQNNEIWLSTLTNLYNIRSHVLFPLWTTNKPIHYLFIYFIDSKNRLWLAEDKVLQISTPGDRQHFYASNINQHQEISSIQEDFNHNIWIGTPEGLLKLKDISFTIIDKYKTAPLDGIYNIIPLPDNRVLLSSGTKTGLLVYQNNDLKQIMPPPSPGNENYYWDPVDAYTYDGRNSLWMVTRFQKLLHFDGKGLKDFSAALHLTNGENIYDLNYAKKRKHFFICADSTLLYGDSSNFSIFIPHNTGIPIIKPTRVQEIQNGLVLLYIDGRGVYCIDTSNNLISLIRETGIDGSKKGVQIPVRFYENNDTSFWIAMPGLGLYEYDFTKKGTAIFKNHLTVKDGLRSNNILSLTRDRQKRLWVATSTGIDILQVNNTGNWEVFNYAKGQELTLSRSDYETLATDAEGNIWLTSPNKIIKFNIDRVRLYKEPPRIIIEKVSLAFKETDWNKLTDSLYSYYQLPYDLVLNYKQNSLGISFNAINLSSSNSDPEYSYKLLPLDTSWSVSSKTKFLSFARLPAGKYQFLVRAKEMASGWSEPAVFRFTIRPPYWEKWWFRLIAIGIAAFIIVGIFRARIKKIKRDAAIETQLKELEMKALKAQMNPHFIYNALNSIQALIANNKKTEAIHYIGSFSRLLRQVLDNSENNVISLDKELETAGLYIQLEALRLDMQLKYEQNISENIVTEFEKIPPLILQPFIENALWHGLDRKEGEKKIKVTVSAMADWLICEIADNGIGRKKAAEWKSSYGALHQSKAIDITRNRLIDFNDDPGVTPLEFIDLYDSQNNPTGTKVIISIKRKISS